MVAADKIQMQQVLLNLLINGIEAMNAASNSRGGEKRLSIETRKIEADKILIAVNDSGAGLVSEEIENIFEAFYTTKTEGMGMGLSISRSIIEAHGGRIWATANDEKGATFQFTLPVETHEE
jgi:signal transduction histidine kinase